MTIPSPFNSDLPLKQNPYRSRIQTQIDGSKNYFMVAFKPGFPLQASELNEMQEIFYVQQTLTQTLFSNWHIKEYQEQNGAAMTGTPWNGCTPLSPDLISYTIINNKISVTIQAGWYLLKQTTTAGLNGIFGGFGVWVYNPTATTILTDYDYTSDDSLDGDYGIIVKQVSINCTTNNTPSTNEDRSLQDSSNINVINGPCGAARIKAEIVGFGKSTDAQAGEVFLPILTASNTTNFAAISFKNLYKIVDVTSQ